MKYPIGQQSFEYLRSHGFCYVDKTAFAYKLADEGKYYFLSRPRRFGKSLFVSMLRAYFEGKKELFEGLAIEQLEQDWYEYPVLFLDLNVSAYDDDEALNDVLKKHLEQWEKRYGDEYRDRRLEERFEHIVRLAYEKTGRECVFLVDEYDKPLLMNTDNQPLQDKFRKTLKSFYSVLKSQDQYFRFAFLTGVSKFSKVSIFSDLNNLDDISMYDCYATVCGITENEIRQYFDTEVDGVAKINKMTKEECYARLRKEYDGYHFCEDVEGVYNPFSLLKTLSKGKFSDYWFETGTPTFLVSLLKRSNFELRQLEEQTIDADTLNSVDAADNNPVAVIYQSGYLTIKGFDAEFGLYKLGFPNGEVERGFTKFLIPNYLPTTKNKGPQVLSEFVNEIRNGNPDRFMQRLDAFLAGGNYQIAGDAELYFQNAVYLIFRFMGYYVQAEYASSDGRMDMLVQTPGFIYLFEFKLDKSADEALAQIEERGYARQFEFDKRKLFCVGVNFSSQTRKVEEWKVV